MSVKAFGSNGKKSENIVKLKLERDIKSLLYNHLVYICVEETDFWQFIKSLPDKTTNFTVKGHKWVSLTWHIVTLIHIW